jgi:hypothetical protein
LFRRLKRTDSGRCDSVQDSRSALKVLGEGKPIANGARSYCDSADIRRNLREAFLESWREKRGRMLKSPQSTIFSRKSECSTFDLLENRRWCPLQKLREFPNFLAGPHLHHTWHVGAKRAATSKHVQRCTNYWPRCARAARSGSLEI